MKYIDAELLRKEIETLKDEYTDIAIDSQRGWANANFVIDDLERLQSQIDSLQQEQPELPQIERAEYYYHKGVYEGLSQGRADALKMLDEFMKRNANPVIVIKQQEQPEIDLEKEYKEYVEDDPVFSKLTNRNVGLVIARHFYELGLNARKEEEK